jgi:hypothetical protein
MNSRRTPAIAIIVAVLLGMSLVDRLVLTEARASRHRDDTAVVGAPGGGAGSTTWYCPGGSTSSDGDAELTVVVANMGAKPVEGIATVVAFSPGAPTPPPAVHERFTVGAHSRFVLNPKEFVQSPHVAVTVEVDGGDVVVEQGVAGSLGFDLSACAISGSDTWYFADGATTRASTLLLHLYNPFSVPAIVDLGFAATEGRAEPADLQGVVVPPRSLVAVNVGDHVRREAAVSTSIVARSGRLVVGKIGRRAEPGQRGLIAGVGAPEAAETWRFPEGVVGGGVVERFHLYNPSDEEASVDLEMVLDEGVFEPLAVPVPAQGRVTLTVNGEAEAGVQVPEGVGHSALFRSLNGVGVVIERGLEASGKRAGIGTTLGGTQAAKKWGLAAGVATSAVEEWIVVQNSSDQPAQVTVTAIVDGRAEVLDKLGGLTVPPLGRRGFRLNDLLAAASPGLKEEVLEAALIVEASRPIVVERAMYRVGRTGISTSLAIPFLP